MFKFRLDPLITIRDNVLKECQAELAKACDARRKAEEAMQIVDDQLAEGAAAARSQMQEGQTINVEYMLGFQRQKMYLRASKDKLTEYMQEIDRNIEICRRAVVAANKELKIVEKLKEKRHEKYREEESKVETKLMDEIGFNRKIAD